MSKSISTFTGVVTVLGILQLFVAGLVGAYPSEEKYINLKRQFPDERSNLTFDNILIPNDEYCNSAELPTPYESVWVLQSLSTPTQASSPARVFNTTQTYNCREHADHQGPFWRAWSLPNVITAGGSLNISRAGPWREGGFGVLSLALGSEKDEISYIDPAGAKIIIYMDGKSRTGGNIASAEFEFPAPPSTWGNYGPWVIATTPGFDIGLKEFHVRAEYRWTEKDGSQGVKPVGTLWVDQVLVRVVKLD